MAKNGGDEGTRTGKDGKEQEEREGRVSSLIFERCNNFWCEICHTHAIFRWEEKNHVGPLFSAHRFYRPFFRPANFISRVIDQGTDQPQPEDDDDCDQSMIVEEGGGGGEECASVPRKFWWEPK